MSMRGFKHGVYVYVNTTCITPRVAGQQSLMPDVHPSFARLAAAAKAVDPALSDLKSLRLRLSASSAKFTNWKTRGVAKEAALEAQRELGISAMWVIDGVEPALLSQSQSARLDQGMMGESLVAILKVIEALRLEFKPGPVAAALVRAYDLRTLQSPQMTAAEREAFDKMIERAVRQAWEGHGEAGTGKEAARGSSAGDAQAAKEGRKAKAG